ncbi:MAG: hypothetical protein QOJ82_3197 [Solirubrobacteraceae bacterium]|jgi:hypothetical protein|nr:hypothetical protein [Solirubrobacteraceae bacterium]
MFDRFRKTSAPTDDPAAVAVADREAMVDEPRTMRDPEVAAPAAPAAEPVSDRPTARERAAEEVAAEREVARSRRRTHPAVVGEDALVAMHERQRDRFGGIRWGSAFFGLLSAVGLASILLSIVVAAGVAIGVSEVKNAANGTSDTIGLGGGIALLAVLAVAWYCGGYVAGRMARFDGPRQGLGVWVWTILIAGAAAALAAIGGSEYNVFQHLNLPNIAVGGTSLTTGGLIALACALVVTLLFAVLGGMAGDRFHRRVDRVAAREYVEAV